MDRFFALLVVFFALSSYGLAPLGNSASTILPPSTSAKTISLPDAFNMALAHHSQLKLAELHHDRRVIARAMNLGALLPKVRLGASYTHNIPEIESSLFKSMSSQSDLSGYVASLLRKNGDIAEAEQLERQSDLERRRAPTGPLVISPKHVLDSKLTIDVPLFNGASIARLIASNNDVLIEEARMKAEESKTLYETAQAFYTALYLRDIYNLREHAEAVAEERFKRAEAQKKRRTIIDSEYLRAKANYFRNQAERSRALHDYRSSIGALGRYLGESEEFSLDDDTIFAFKPASTEAEVLVDMALKNRPDLKVLRLNKNLINSARFGEVLQCFPNINLQGDGKYTSNKSGLTGKNFTYAISLNVSMSLFDGGQSLGRLRDTSLQHRENDIAVRQLQWDIRARIYGHQERLQELLLLASASKMEAEAEEEAEFVANARYAKGLIELEKLLEISDRKLIAASAFKKAQADINLENLAIMFETGTLMANLLP